MLFWTRREGGTRDFNIAELEQSRDIELWKILNLGNAILKPVYSMPELVVIQLNNCTKLSLPTMGRMRGLVPVALAVGFGVLNGS